MTATDSHRDAPTVPRGFRPAANWVAVLVIPLGVFLAALAADLNAGERSLYDIDRFAVLALFAGLLQLVVLAAAATWWSADLVGTNGFGTLMAAARVVAMTFSTTLLLLVLALLQDRAGTGAMLRVQLVVLGWGLLLAGSAGLLRVLLRRTSLAAIVTSLAAFLVLTTPFWGNVLIALVGRAGTSSARAFVTGATPLSACSQAVGHDLFRGRLLYNLSVVAGGDPHTLPVWWVYALITGLAGAALVALVTFARRHVVIRAVRPVTRT